ncbi:FecR family protein [Chitinophaga niastensis]|uniref:FecR family protein n=1 Tax=Chitinophaga niastensis TaxID=536980 RepID=A0A2P8HA37_CHINA|nr:FecR domain-containing protein [Chitinophaga niastensis]PSL43061.1 FecR family protein [Chitinophaga niastensis]
MKQHPTVDGYLTYDANDFLADEYFQEWVKYNHPETAMFWQQLQELHPEKKKVIQEAFDLLSSMRFKTRTPDESRTRRIWEYIDVHTPEHNIRHINWHYKKMLAAASILLLIVLGFWQWRKTQFIYKDTAGSEISRILLPDHSEVILNANSRLKYAKDFNTNNKRELWIEGEAFFSVKPFTDGEGKSQPFIVHSTDLDVLVTGTAFNVYARRQLTRVVLNHGRVTIQFKNNRETARQLLPGEMLEYNETKKSLLQQPVDTLLFTSWKQQRFIFTNTPLKEVAQIIEDFYGCKVVFKDQELASYKITAEIDAPDIASLDTLLSKALNIRVTKDGNTLILESKP